MSQENVHYLDHNATSPMSEPVREAFLQATEALWGNADSPHALGRAARVAVENARDQVAALVGCPSHQVSFTSGATESNAWALSGVHSETRPNVIVSAVEHPSVLAWGTHQVGVDSQGRIDLAQLEVLLDHLGESVAVVSVMAANNETGVLQPITEVAALARASGARFHCDATQLPGRVPVQVDADLITLSAHKMGGPKGVGVLIADQAPPAMLRGGPQERERRAGTSNVPGIVAMGVAAVHAGIQGPEQRDRLEQCCIDLGGRVLGGEAERLPNTSSVLFSVPGDLMVMALDLKGVLASTGSACASGSSQPSHVLQAMGVQGTPVRFSLGSDSDVEPVFGILKEVVGNLASLGTPSSGF